MAPGFGSENSLTCLAMELVEGSKLARQIPPGGLPRKTFRSIATQIANAIEKAHRAAIRRRDRKPGNIMLTDGGKAMHSEIILALMIQRPGRRMASGSPFGGKQICREPFQAAWN
jgi:serine/threonine protein kinase